MALLFLIALVNIELADWTSFPGKSCLTGMTPKTWSDWENTGVAARLEECRQQCISSMLCGAAEIRNQRSGFRCLMFDWVGSHQPCSIKMPNPVATLLVFSKPLQRSKSPDISIKKVQDEHGAWCRMSKDTHAFGLRAHRVAKERISPHDEVRGFMRKFIRPFAATQNKTAPKLVHNITLGLMKEECKRTGRVVFFKSVYLDGLGHSLFGQTSFSKRPVSISTNKLQNLFLLEMRYQP